MPGKTKICLGCKIQKSISDFYDRPVSKQYPDGKRSRCKKCENAEGRQWARDNKEKHAAQMANWRKNNPEKQSQTGKRYREKNSEKVKERYSVWKDKNKDYIKEYGGKWRMNNKEKMRIGYLRSRYNLTVGDYNELGNKQKWNCAICGIHTSASKRGLFIDHCHESNKIRGLLCGNCNLMIGYAKDSKEILTKAIKYLHD